MTDFLADLRAVLPAVAVRTDPDSLAPRLLDQRQRYQGAAQALVLPASAEEAAAVLAVCRHHRVAVVPQAGNTGLVGGATPPYEGRSIVLACDRLDRIRHIDPVGYTMTAEAGCILDHLHDAASQHDRLFPLWLGSSGSARLGGLLSTNAGGLQVLRYGNARELCLGIEAVLPDGRLYHGLHPLRKRNVGYDLKQWLIGAEGTLGFITAATLRLWPRPQGRATALVALDDLSAVLKLFQAAKAQLGEVLSAFELIGAAALCQTAMQRPDCVRPFDPPPPWAALLEVSGGETDAVLEERLGELLTAGGWTEAVLASSLAQAEALWTLREAIPDAQRRAGPSIKHDISLPLDRLAEFVALACARLATALPEAQPVVFGHIGDGNLHFNLSLPREAVDRFDALEAHANELVFELTRACGGDISAEHGIGRLRREQADRWLDPVERGLMRQIKACFDPDGLMNPGVLL
ncbi:FAD-binding oxidoreductase [Chitinimonas lacunae]|uniref:FAD-binding oxidoreductase n=1 Tax=Chitinimonas lacunae TaxID=1963018 RepID=A0ABV8MXQ3_9NEIS